VIRPLFEIAAQDSDQRRFKLRTKQLILTEYFILVKKYRNPLLTIYPRHRGGWTIIRPRWGPF
jgi:hypothetical protein